MTARGAGDARAARSRAGGSACRRGCWSARRTRSAPARRGLRAPRRRRRAEILEGCGHFVPEERPARVAERARELIASARWSARADRAQVARRRRSRGADLLRRRARRRRRRGSSRGAWRAGRSPPRASCEQRDGLRRRRSRRSSSRAVITKSSAQLGGDAGLLAGRQAVGEQDALLEVHAVEPPQRRAPAASPAVPRPPPRREPAARRPARRAPTPIAPPARKPSAAATGEREQRLPLRDGRGGGGHGAEPSS